MRLHHLALGANDVRKVATFYADAFELEYLKEHHYDDGSLRSIWLRLGEGVLMIEHVEHEKNERPIMDHGLFLVAFEVSPEERTEVERRLDRLGATLETRGENTSYYLDPENNRVAISVYRFSI